MQSSGGIWIITWLNMLYHLLSGWGGFTPFFLVAIMHLSSNPQGSPTYGLLVLACTNKMLFSSSSPWQLIVMKLLVAFWICLSRFAKKTVVQTFIAPFIKANWFMLFTVLELIYDRPVVVHLSFMIYHYCMWIMLSQ